MVSVCLLIWRDGCWVTGSDVAHVCISSYALWLDEAQYYALRASVIRCRRWPAEPGSGHYWTWHGAF
jgi:hypothetical protein